jgi:hypothetical protein
VRQVIRLIDDPLAAVKFDFHGDGSVKSGTQTISVSLRA